MRKLLLSLFSLSMLTGVAAAAPAVKWEKEGPGVWNLTVGRPDTFNLTSALELTPRTDAMQSLGDSPLPIDTSLITTQLIDGKTYLRLPLDKGEKIFGLGLNFKTVEQRGRLMRLHVDHYGKVDNGRTHAPVPFYVSSKGYGALINAARYIDVYVGTSNRVDSKNAPQAKDSNTDRTWEAMPYSDNLEFLIPAEGVEVVFFTGDNMLDVVRRYNLYQGGGALPPRWGLGFWHRTPTRFTDRQVLDEVAEFRRRNFPLTVIGLEPGWMSKAYPCTYQWDAKRFPEPQGFLDSLTAQNIRTNVLMNAGVSPDCDVYGTVKPLSSSHTLWNGLVPDYSLPQVRDIMAGHFLKHQLNLGVSGYKMDENDGFDQWIFPDVATFPSGHTAEQMRQVYGSLMQKTTTDMYRAANRRTYGLVRSANAGTASFPYVLYNDYYNHRDFITALINSSFIGVLWTPEVRGSKTSEDWLRRMQTVCFSPLAMLNAWADGTKPWSFADVEKDVYDIAMLRMQLIPYLYTAFADYHFEGTPPVRAMNLEPAFTTETTVVENGKLDGTDNPYAMASKREMKDQFMVGRDLLVAPLFAGETERKVVLPQGKWYDFYTGEYAGEGEVITAAPGLARIPVYVRDGAIVPLFPPIAKLDGKKLPLEIRHYGEKPGSFSLYDDDGETFDYENGNYTRIKLRVEIKKGKKKGYVDVPKGARVWSFDGNYNFKFMTLAGARPASSSAAMKRK